jgi:hypothetical protein
MKNSDKSNNKLWAITLEKQIQFQLLFVHWSHVFHFHPKKKSQLSPVDSGQCLKQRMPTYIAPTDENPIFLYRCGWTRV